VRSVYKSITYSALWMVTAAIAASTRFIQPHPFDTPFLDTMRHVIVFFASILLAKYFFYMVVAPFYDVIESRRVVTTLMADYYPLVSVMIPAWNEEVGLLGTVKTLLDSTYRHVELVIVNDGSTDGSHAMMLNFVSKYNEQMTDVPEYKRIRILYHYQPNGGKGSALNTAIQLSHGAILLSIDADCHVHARCIEEFVNAFRNPKVMAAVGNVRVGNTKSLVGTIQYLEYIFGFYFKKADSLLNTIYIIGGAAGAFRREVFQVIGGYNTKNITEDIELSVRIQEQGWKIVYCPGALVLTEGASTLTGLKKQRYRWKYGRFQTFMQHRNLFFSTERRHNKLLCWVILPLAIFGEVQLGLELLFITMLYVFALLSGDFSAFLSGVFVVSLMFGVQAHDSGEFNISTLLLAPIGWLLFYVTTYVEVYALIRSIWNLIRKRDVQWQKWKRTGVQ